RIRKEMDSEKLKQLFGAAKKETPMHPTEGFNLLVMQRIRRNPARAPFSIFDQLGLWYPRLALATAALIVLCVAGDVVFSSVNASFDETAAQLSDQMILAEN